MRLFLLGQCDDQRVEGIVSYRVDDTPLHSKLTLYANRSINVALMAVHHAEHHNNIHCSIITLPVWLENATTVPLVPPLEICSRRWVC
jgi:hypothetical protein